MALGRPLSGAFPLALGGYRERSKITPPMLALVRKNEITKMAPTSISVPGENPNNFLSL